MLKATTGMRIKQPTLRNQRQKYRSRVTSLAQCAIISLLLSHNARSFYDNFFTVRIPLSPLVALIILVVAISLLVTDVRGFLRSPLVPSSGRSCYTVLPHTSLPTLAADLARLGVIKRPIYFIVLAWWRGDWRRFQAGEYLLQAGITPSDLMDRMASGQVFLHSITFIEGWNFSEVREAISQNEHLAHTLNHVSDADIMKAIHAPDTAPEGMFFPDTYRFPAGTTDVIVLERAWRTMQTHLNQEWARRASNLFYHNPYEVLTLASLIEKETAAAEERPRIAGVFLRRLQRHMPLQTDPTVIYGLGRTYDGSLRHANLLTETPYNTYLHQGLPPTPIALPGLAALHAALHPASGEELYFVSRGDKTHQFSVTLQEHNAAVHRYRGVTNRSTDATH